MTLRFCPLGGLRYCSILVERKLSRLRHYWKTMALGWPSTTRQHSESQVSSKWSDFEPISPKLGGNGCWKSSTGTSSSPTKPKLLKRELASDLALPIKCPLLASFPRTRMPTSRPGTAASQLLLPQPQLVCWFPC